MSSECELTALRIDNRMLMRENESMEEALRVARWDYTVMYGIVKENAKLIKTNDALRTEIERLGGRIEKLEKLLRESENNETRAMVSNQRLLETVTDLQNRLFDATFGRE
jgi:hypothetical protein